MMNAARGIFLAARRNRKPTARSYVQDGLIAMWDGIENAGWGVHDAASTTWKDLVGNRDFVDVHAFGRDALTLSTSINSASASWIIPYNQIVCMEVVLQLDSIDSSAVLLNVGTSYHYSWADVGKRGIFKRLEDGGTLKIDSLSFTQSRTYALQNTPSSRISLSQNFNGADSVANGFRVNGEIVATTNISASGLPTNTAIITKGSGCICSIRLYSRALTASEVAHNCVVDKARFNLPDAT